MIDFDGLQCFDRVMDEVSDDLLQLPLAAHNDGNSSANCRRVAISLSVRAVAERAHCSPSYLIHVDGLSFPIGLPEHGTNALQYLTGTLRLSNHLG